MLRLILVLFLAISVMPPQQALAQAPGAQVDGSSSTGGPRKQLATIVFAGLAGAILGLSTLSFYGRPQDNLSNIAIGFAVGVIVGTSYTTYQAATKPYEFYGNANPSQLDLEMDYLKSRRVASGDSAPGFSYQFSF